MRTLRPGGFLFLGDVRNYSLHEALQASVALHQAADNAECTELAARVAHHLASEQELLIDPEFFLAIAERVGARGGVEMQLKRGRHQHELTAFRYDVLLHVGAHPPMPKDTVRLDWQAESLTLADLETQLATSDAARIEVTRIPNARVMSYVRTARRLAAGDCEPTAAALRAAIAVENSGGIDPEALWGLATAHPYDVAVGWSPGREECIDVVFSGRTAPLNGSGARPYLAAPVSWPIATGRSRVEYGTRPVRGTMSPALVPDVRRYMVARLPEYMIPTALVVLDAIPLTATGKLDRRALPAPEGVRPELSSAYVAPRNDVEEALAGIWAEVLGLDQVGMHDNFFDLGGHSLLATQVMSRVRERLDVSVPLRELFREPTIAQLARLVADARLGGLAAQLPPIERADRSRPLPLSFAQERLWFLDQLQPGNPFYNGLTAVRIRGPLDRGGAAAESGEDHCPARSAADLVRQDRRRSVSSDPRRDRTTVDAARSQ